MGLISPDQTPEYVEIAKNVFKPGNLVWGNFINSENMGELLRRGIMTSSEVGRRGYGFTPDVICLALLDKTGPPSNYRVAGHLGPATEDSENIGIVLDREEVMEKFPIKFLPWVRIFTKGEIHGGMILIKKDLLYLRYLLERYLMKRRGVMKSEFTVRVIPKLR